MNAPRAGSTDALAKDADAETPKSVFDWGMGTSRSQGLFQSGLWQPDGWQGMGYEDRYWMCNSYARQSWPLSIRGRALQLAVNLNQATAGEFSTLDAAMSAEFREGILENLSLALSGGLRKSRHWGTYRSYDLRISKGWFFESMGMGLETGFSGEWDAEGKRLSDQAWITLGRDIGFESGNTLGFSLKAAAERLDSQYDWITTSVLYVDDVSKASPPISAPRIFSLPHGFGAVAGARCTLDLYPESAWDWVPMPGSMDLANADLVGLAYNRADGRYYAAALAEENGVLQESYGMAPLQRRKANRLDQRAGLAPWIFISRGCLGRFRLVEPAQYVSHRIPALAIRVALQSEPFRELVIPMENLQSHQTPIS